MAGAGSKCCWMGSFSLSLVFEVLVLWIDVWSKGVMPKIAAAERALRKGGTSRAQAAQLKI